MTPKIPLLKEVTYKDYKDNVGTEGLNYVRYIVIPNYITEPEELGEFALANLDNFNNTDINKYYLMVGIIANEFQEEEEKRLGKLSISN